MSITAHNKVLKLSKFVGKLLLVLLFVILSAVALIHVPSIQRQITHRISNYLSSKIKSKVEIQNIYFSILGNVTIENFQVWNPDQHNILSVDKIEVTSNPFKLITGNFNFDEIRIEGVTTQLIQDEEGFNIQFILDAFQPDQKPERSPSGAVNLLFKKLTLENITIEFTSAVSGLTLDTHLGKFSLEDAAFIQHPNKLSAKRVYLEKSQVNILTVVPRDTTDHIEGNNNEPLLPNFGIGVDFDVKDIELKDNDFSFHRDMVASTPEFDPSHLTVSDIKLQLSNIIVHQDTLAASLQNLSAQVHGFLLSEARADIHANQRRLTLSGLHLASQGNVFDADLTGSFDPHSIHANFPSSGNITGHGQVNPRDIAYFLGDSATKYFNAWTTTAISIKVNYTLENVDVETFNLKTENSQLQVKGIWNRIAEIEKTNWKDVTLSASIGTDFRNSIAPIIKEIQLPPTAMIELNTSGTLNRINTNGKFSSPWGNVTVEGAIDRTAGNYVLDGHLSGEHVNLGAFANQSWLGPTSLVLNAKGNIGDNLNIDLNGIIGAVAVQNTTVHQISFHGKIENTAATAAISIDDPNYRAKVNSEISFAGPILIKSEIQLDTFYLGKLLQSDSSLAISGKE